MIVVASPGKRIPALALAGGLAGLATCASSRLLVLLPDGLSESIGCIFGLFLCAYFWLFDETRSVWRALGFVGASALAYLAAYNAGMPGSNLWPARFELLGLNSGEINVLFVGGFVGAALLFLAWCFFFPSRQSALRLLLNFVVFVISGGVLGVVGYALGPSLGVIIWHLLRFLHLGEPSQASQLQPSPDTSSFYSMYVVWQTGVATLVALLFPLHSEARGSSPSTAIGPASAKELDKTPLPLWKRLVAVALIFLVVFFAASEVHGLKIMKAQQEQQQKEIVQSDAEAPSLANLAEVEPREPDQVLFLQAISGHEPDGGSVTASPPCDLRGGQQPLLRCVSYFVSYYGFPFASSKQLGTPSFDVFVTEYPNSAWASYSLRNYPARSALITQRKSIQKVPKFGNSIYLNSAWIYPDGKGTAYFYWPSGNFTVAVRFYGPTDDLVLQKYLALHPSSL
jgi:hypothetical protein